MGMAFVSLTLYASCRVSTLGNETETRWEPNDREDGVRTDGHQVSCWATGRILPNRTMIRQKHIPSIGLDCGDLARLVHEHRRR